MTEFKRLFKASASGMGGRRRDLIHTRGVKSVNEQAGDREDGERVRLAKFLDNDERYRENETAMDARGTGTQKLADGM